ncbi:hypothetical protein [Nostoc sp.]
MNSSTSKTRQRSSEVDSSSSNTRQRSSEVESAPQLTKVCPSELKAREFTSSTSPDIIQGYSDNVSSELLRLASRIKFYQPETEICCLDKQNLQNLLWSN